MSLLSQKLSELWPFSWVNSRRNLKPIKLSNLKISLTFWDLDPIFFLMWNQNILLNAYTNFQGQRTIWRPLTQYGFLEPPPMNLSGPGGPWQIGLKKGERIASVGFGQISNFFIRPIEIHHNNQTMHIVYLHFHWDSRGVSAKSKKKSNFAWNTRDFMALNKCTRPS